MNFIELRTKYLMIRARIEWMELQQDSLISLLERYRKVEKELAKVVARRNNREKRRTA